MEGHMIKNLLMGGKKPMPSMKAEPLGLGTTPFTQRSGKMKITGLGKKAKRVAEEAPTGPMKGIK
jgi:hypothetical protein